MTSGYRSGVPARPFLYAALAGAFGMNLLLVATQGAALLREGGVPAVVMVVLGYGVLTLPFVAAGLLVLGVGPTMLFRRRLLHPVGAVLAVLLGWAGGKLWWLVLDRTLGFGVYDPFRRWLLDEPVGFGVVTAIAWWFFLRRWLIARAAV